MQSAGSSTFRSYSRRYNRAISTFTDNDFCFACGSKNPLGLQLQFFSDGPRFCTRFVAQPQWQGFHGVLHGGLQATVLDDLMSNHLFRVERVWVVTAEISVRFKAPVPIERELLFASEVVNHSGKLWTMRAECTVYGEGKVLSAGTARFMEVRRP
jgi:acyl-coenzyme A thioesterase PaaI-like protein